MGRELQKRKNRSSRAKVTMGVRRKKQLNPAGSGIIAKNWNKKETLSQNYSRFGLVAKLGTTAGGVSKKPGQAPKNPLAYKSADQGMLKVQEVKVERDASGKITRIIRNQNPLNDPLNELDSDNEDGDPFNCEDDGKEWSGIENSGEEQRIQTRPPVVLAELEREASQPEIKHVRHQSEREREWLEKLVAKHGDDVEAMARDMKLNPMQQTKGDLARRLKKAGLV
ncbi:ribosome biogenesis protein Nop16 [Apodospora peruviana]|uniref:Nucleolar protein 16 n=1 Tax=Apodospora peruviana TaxID=516989 RepID=A0AAE0MBP5_9PEZI|nr:ribosome biogenesis protein Nop16 [Apodospora peruviana]